MSSSTNIDSLAEQCLRYIRLEETFVERTLSSVNAVREALRTRDLVGLEASLKRVAGPPPQQLVRMRQTVRTAVAINESIPIDRVRLEHVAAIVSAAHHTDLQPVISSIFRKRDEIARINRSNIAISLSMSRMLDRFLQFAAGISSVTTYGRNGQLSSTSQSRVLSDQA